MKKTLSLLMAVAMLVSCFAFSSSAMAETIPQLKIGSPVTVTAVKNGKEETAQKLAKFIPTENGCYEFECTTPYKSAVGSNKEEVPGGIFSAELITSDSQSTQGMSFFLDLSHLTDAEYNEFKKAGMDVEHINQPRFTADLKKGTEYIIMMYHDGGDDYTTDITVKKHTHILKKGIEEKVKVKKNGTSDDMGGIYDQCTEWYCAHIDYTTYYKQIEETKVKNAVYTGKAVKPAVSIITTDGKKLNKKYYSLSYKNNKKIGKGTVTIKFKNGYVGTATKTFKINPKSTAIKSVTARRKQLRVNYKKVANSTGYQIQVATNKKFTKGKKTITVKGAKKTAATVKKLKAKKKYYVRVRAYKTVNKTKYYSSWSKVQTKKTR